MAQGWCLFWYYLQTDWSRDISVSRTKDAGTQKVYESKECLITETTG